MAYAILRIEKKKSKRDVIMTLDHNTRERTPPNAEPGQTGLNWTFGGSTQEALIRFNERLPEKVRSNAVLAIELVMTASPEMKANWTKYLNACDRWATDTFGAGNLIHIAHHRDEKTPHTHVIIQPLFEGKLNARHFIGGSRDRLAELQEDFYQKVGSQFELERGRSREETRARHTHHRMTDIEDREKKLEEAEAKIKIAEEIIKPELKLLNDLGIQAVAGKWRPEFAQRVMKHAQKKFPEFMEKCGAECLKNLDRPARQVTHNIERKPGFTR
jgi:hypothetical protein